MFLDGSDEGCVEDPLCLALHGVLNVLYWKRDYDWRLDRDLSVETEGEPRWKYKRPR